MASASNALYIRVCDMVLCVFVAVVSMSRYDTSSILLRSMFLNTRQHCTFPRDCVVLLCVGGQSTLTGVGIRVSGPLCDNFMYKQFAMSYTRVDSLSTCLSLYVCHDDDRYVTAFAYYDMDNAHYHIPEQSLYPSVCLSLYVLPC